MSATVDQKNIDKAGLGRYCENVPELLSGGCRTHS